MNLGSINYDQKHLEGLIEASSIADSLLHGIKHLARDVIPLDLSRIAIAQVALTGVVKNLDQVAIGELCRSLQFYFDSDRYVTSMFIKWSMIARQLLVLKVFYEKTYGLDSPD